MISIVIISSLLLIWYLESRVLLALFHRLWFSFTKNPPIIKNEQQYLDVDTLEKNWQIIRDEVKKVLVLYSSIPRFHEIDPLNRKISFTEGPAWRIIILKAFDGWLNDNCTVFPKTFELLKQYSNASSAFISIIEPGCIIPPHKGKLKGIYNYHLGLVVPKSPMCYLTIDGERVHWQEGKSILFDDTFIHSVNNQTDEQRIVLFLNVKRKMPYVIDVINSFLLLLVKISPVYRKGIRKGQII